jgi:Cu/Ag efflux protein CusF
MKAIFYMTAALVALSPLAGHAQDRSAPPRSVPDAAAVGETIRLVGEITAIDKENRRVTVRGPRTGENSYYVDPSVANFENMKVGDRVNLEFRTAFALALRKGGTGIRERVEQEASAAQVPGEQRPGISDVRRTTIVSNVDAVDRKKQTVSLTGPEGNTLQVRVRNPDLLKDVKKGDQVVAVMTEAVAISVTPATGPGSARP